MESPKTGPEIRKTKGSAVELEIKRNNAATNDPCAVCGRRTDPECGPELFLARSWALVCYECGAQYAPELMECLAVYRESPEFLRRNGVEMDDLQAQRVKAIRRRHYEAIMEDARARELASGESDEWEFPF